MKPSTSQAAPMCLTQPGPSLWTCPGPPLTQNLPLSGQTPLRVRSARSRVTCSGSLHGKLVKSQPRAGGSLSGLSQRCLQSKAGLAKRNRCLCCEEDLLDHSQARLLRRPSCVWFTRPQVCCLALYRQSFPKPCLKQRSHIFPN